MGDEMNGIPSSNEGLMFASFCRLNLLNYLVVSSSNSLVTPGRSSSVSPLDEDQEEKKVKVKRDCNLCILLRCLFLSLEGKRDADDD